MEARAGQRGVPFPKACPLQVLAKAKGRHLVVKAGALPDQAGLVRAGAERRNRGVILNDGKFQPKAR